MMASERLSLHVYGYATWIWDVSLQSMNVVLP